MEWLNVISNKDSIVQNISIEDGALIVYILLWNGEMKRLKFNNFDEIAAVKSIMFYNAWNETVLLEVLADNVEFEQTINLIDIGVESV